MKNSFKINKTNFYLGIILFLFWIIGSIPIKTTLSLNYSKKKLIASYNHQPIAILPVSDFQFLQYKILDTNNLPQPNLFSSSLISSSIDNANNFYEFTFKNLYYAEIAFYQPNSEYYSLHFIPFWDRTLEILHYNSSNEIIDKASEWRSFKFPPIILFRMILFIVSRPFPLVFIWLIISKIFIKTKKYTNIYPDIFPSFLNILFIFIYLYLLLTNIIFVQMIPHSPDSAAYFWAAKYLAAGKLWLPIPSESFGFDYQSYTFNHWTILWPIGHPLVLALGSFFNATFIIPPLIGTLTLYIFYKIIKLKFSTFISIISTLFFFFSPFFQMHATTFMSHNTAAFFVTILIYFILKYHSKSSLLLTIISATSLILLSQTRLYTAVILTISLSLIFLYHRFSPRSTTYIFIILCLIFSGIFLIINKISYDSFLQTPYRLLNQSKTIFYDSSITFAHTITDLVSNLQVFRLVIFPGLPLLFFFLITLSFFNFKHRKLILFCFFNILGIICISLTFDDPWGLFYGPRFWYETIPFIFILVAIGLDYLSYKPLIIFIFLIIAYRGIFGWTLNIFPLWKNMFFSTPSSISGLKSFNFVDDRLIKAAKNIPSEKKLIFVKDCLGSWWCYGSVFPQNTINFDSNTVWVKDINPIENQSLINLYPSYKIYLADYENSEIFPYEN